MQRGDRLSRPLAFGSAIALVLSAFVSALAFGALHTNSGPLSGSTGSPLAASPITIWEAYAKGKATIQQVNVTFEYGGEKYTEPIGYRVRNLGTVPINIDEKVMLMSPHPLHWSSGGQETSQEGVLTYSTVPAGGQVTYNYAELVIAGRLPEPKWWCMEANQVVSPPSSTYTPGQTTWVASLHPHLGSGSFPAITNSA